jgi:hypothetical protein
VSVEIHDRKIAGMLCYWWTHDCRWQELRDGFDAMGLGRCIPCKRSTRTAIKAALVAMLPEIMVDTLPGSRWLVRPLDKQRGYQVTRENPGSKSNSYDCICSVPVNGPGDMGWTGPMRFHQRFVQNFQRECAVIGKDKVSRALAIAVESLGGLPMRLKGSVYWLPEDSVHAFTVAAELVQSASVSKGEQSQVHMLRVVYDGESLAAITAAIKEEMREMQSELADLSAMKPAELGRRQKQLEAYRERLGNYEQHLSQPMPDLRERLDALDRAIMVASLLPGGAS